jgi:hypothetical protein
VSVAAVTGVASSAKSALVRIKPERALALMIICQSPHFASPNKEKDPPAVSVAGQKKGIFGQALPKTRQAPPQFASQPSS